jgi:protoporphyrinogen IX oxidase
LLVFESQAHSEVVVEPGSGMPGSVKKRLIRAIVGVATTAAVVIALVIWRPSGLYPWFKAFHIIAVMSWMAGMLYLPRLFVYHCGAEKGSRQSETFKVMERRLLRGIINPAMVASWALGLWMVYDGGWILAPWLHAKLLLVVVLSGVHGMLARWTNDFAADQNRHSERFYRIVNEVPAVLMVGIVIMVVIKPF